MPTPPSSFGIQTRSHATKQWPPWASFRPFQRNPRRIFLIANRVSIWTSRDIKAKMGIAARVDLTSSKRPARLSMEARQLGKRFATASTRLWCRLAPTKFRLNQLTCTRSSL
jgi:hypothetical protein